MIKEDEAAIREGKTDIALGGKGMKPTTISNKECDKIDKNSY